MQYAQKSIITYLDDLSARTPAPGGGSAAALSAAMAASLLAMSAGFSMDKEKYRHFKRRAKAIRARGEALQKKLLGLLDEDIRAYASRDIGQSIRVPAEVCFASFDILNGAAELIRCGNRNLASDAVLAAFLAESAFIGCLFYVRVNVGRLRDGRGKRYVKLLRRLEALEPRIRRLRRKAEVDVGRSLGR